MNKILQKIFYQKNKKWQTWLASIGFLMGLLILLIAMQLYIQINELFSGRKEASYLLISKPVGLSNMLTFSQSNFSETDIADLKKQPFVEAVGEVIANQFEVMAYVKRVNFYSELFFEAVEDKFLDTNPREFRWVEGQELIPVIIARDMLDLYNFGFAMGKGGSLPQISPSTAKLITIDIRLQGNGGDKIFKGKIVGFSERISSILVPMNFMKWANATLGQNKPKNSSRLLLKVPNVASPELIKYLETNNYQINQDRLQAGKIAGIVQGIIAGLGVVGMLFLVMAVFMFLMTFKLILAEACHEIGLLLELGYTPSQLSIYLMRGFAIWVLFLGILVGLGLYVGEGFTSQFLVSRGVEVAHGLQYAVVGAWAGLLLLTLTANWLNIRSILK